MVGAEEMKLVFRLGGVGFALPIAQLLEIVEGELCSAVTVAAPASREAESIFRRGDAIRLRDLGQRLELIPGAPETGSVLVLTGADGPWGVRVDAVDGIHPGDEFVVRMAPSWMFRSELWPFRNLLLWRGQPLVQVDALELEARWDRVQ